MSKILTLIGCMFLTAFVHAQRISGFVKDEKGKAIASASITLQQAKDSAIVKLSVTDKEGNFIYNNISAGKYFVSVVAVGYQKQTSAVFELGTIDFIVPAFSLQKAVKQLEGVTVTSKKPMIEVKADKTIVNIEGSINAQGSDAFELLRKSPGVTVDRDDNISLSGKNGVQIYIDGKPSPLSGKNLPIFYVH
jgi:hypothetical protein